MPLHDTNSRRHHHRHRALLLLAIFRQRARILAAARLENILKELFAIATAGLEAILAQLKKQ